MSSDFNVFKNGYTVRSHQQQAHVVIDKDAIQRTLENLTAPVFDFFSSSKSPEETAIVDYESAIKKYEMRSAVIQRILNDSDPKSRTTMNVVI